MHSWLIAVVDLIGRGSAGKCMAVLTAWCVFLLSADLAQCSGLSSGSLCFPWVITAFRTAKVKWIVCRYLVLPSFNRGWARRLLSDTTSFGPQCMFFIYPSLFLRNLSQVVRFVLLWFQPVLSIFLCRLSWIIVPKNIMILLDDLFLGELVVVVVVVLVLVAVFVVCFCSFLFRPPWACPPIALQCGWLIRWGPHCQPV